MSQIFIVHYHLNPGGVTRIIESHVRALTEYGKSENVLLLTGTEIQAGNLIGPQVICKVNEMLNYLPEDESVYMDTFNSLNGFFKKELVKDDILHVHNLNLGKNPILTLVISEMAQQGYRVVNHVHDFAEDRPENMEYLKRVIEGFFKKNLNSILYPNVSNYFYTPLTSYDLQRLQGYGIQNERLFLLPNPVTFHLTGNPLNNVLSKKKVCRTLQLDAKKMLITYPVRVIRRKNIGEYILLAFLFSDKAHWLVTLPPQNPVEIEPYLQWKSFCMHYKIPLTFEVGSVVTFEEVISASDLCFTTSIQEGFGMVFLEPWLFDKPVAGRKIKHVTDDIAKTGVDFPLLYDEFIVNSGNTKTDFATLSQNQQQQYIESVVKNESLKKELFTDNPFLGKLLTSVSKSLIERNKSIILNEYSIVKYAERLKRIYQAFA
jgi:glycosyltransferase involved in cell wall biosynthesis